MLLDANGRPMPGLLVYELTSSSDGKWPVAKVIIDTWDDAGTTPRPWGEQ